MSRQESRQTFHGSQVAPASSSIILAPDLQHTPPPEPPLLDDTAQSAPEPAAPATLEDTVEDAVEAVQETAQDVVSETVQVLTETAAHGAHSTVADIGNIAAVATIAVLMGLVFVRLRQPPIVGYIVAGLLMGPTGLGIVQQSDAITLLAELGVLLLLFLIGMELSIRAFVLVLMPAVLVATGQITAGLGVSLLFGWLLEWDWPQTLLIGFIIAVSSTAVAIKVLEDIDELRSETGRITVGVMIAQDIAIVPMLIIAESFTPTGEGSSLMGTLALILISISVLALLIWYMNKPGKITLPFTRYFAGKPDLITLAMLAFCFFFATVASLFGLSAVYGAFIAGLIIANSTLRTEAIRLTYPVQSILVFVFFLSVGLLIDLDYVMANWQTVLGFVLMVTIAKSFLNVALVRRVGFGWDVALPSGLAMAQIGEFSFILAAVGASNAVLDADAYRLVLAVIAISLMISPIWMVAIRRFHDETTEGISNMREALALAYASELQSMQKAGTAVSRARMRGRIYRRATRMAASKRKLTREQRKAERIKAQTEKPDPASDVDALRED